MMRSRTRLDRAQRRLDKLAPAERIVMRVIWHDEATGEEEPAGEVVLGDGAPRVIQLRWPEDEDDEKRTRQDALGRA